MPRIVQPGFLRFLFFARRGGNYSNASNSGLGYVNGNNGRANSNTNYGGRPRSHIPFVTQRLCIGVHSLLGGVRFLRRYASE